MCAVCGQRILLPTADSPEPTERTYRLSCNHLYPCFQSLFLLCLKVCFSCLWSIQGCRQGRVGWGLKPPPPQDFKLMLLCVQVVTAKGSPKCINKRGKNGFQVTSSVTHTKLRSVQYVNSAFKLQVVLHIQSLEVSNMWIRLSLCATNSILEAKPPTHFSKVVYTPAILVHQTAYN